MAYFTARFVQLFLVLLALGTFDGAPWLSSNTQPRSGVSAAPVKPVAARIGIVLKDDDGDSTAANSLAPSRRGSSFESYDLAKGNNKEAHSVPLHKIDARDSGNVHPLMLFQQHMNRANVKLAKMQNRSPPTPNELAQAILNRRRSIEDAHDDDHERRYITVSNQNNLQQRATFKSSSSKLPSAHGRIGVVLTSQVDNADAADDDDSTPATSAGEKRLWAGLFSSTKTDDGDKGDDSSDGSSTSTMSSSKSKDVAKAKEKASQMAYSDTLTEAAPVTAANSLGLAIEANNIGYVATIQIGADNTSFKMLIDSGSADTWVPSEKCNACGSQQQKLSQSVSNTLQTSKDRWSITYGTGNARGYLASDQMSIAGLSLKNFTFALASYESDDFSSSPFDGLMGLAQEKLANSQTPTPIDALYNANVVKAPVMGYKLGDATATYSNGKRQEKIQQDGQVTFGGVDSTKYNGSLVEIPNVSSLGFYEIPIEGVSIDGKAIDGLGDSTRTSILDTGTSLMVAPQADAEAVHAQIPGSTSDGQGGFTIPCNSSSILSFKFGGQDWPLLARDMIFVPLNEDDPNGDCVSALGGGDVGQKGEWLVGAAALKRLYFATNAKENIVGLGKLSDPQK